MKRLKIRYGCHDLDVIFQAEAVDVARDTLKEIWAFGFRWANFLRKSKHGLSHYHQANRLFLLNLA